MEDNHSETKTLLKVWSIIFITLSYCYFIASKIPKGKLRLLSILPILILYTILPMYLSYVFTIGITSSFVTWLTNFKLLLYAFDLGPLNTYVQPVPVRGQDREGSVVRSLTGIKPYLMFLFVGAFPIKVKDLTSNTMKSSKVLPLNIWSKILISSILIAYFDTSKKDFKLGVTLVLYSLLLCFLIDIAMGLSNVLLRPIIGSELLPPSNEPYLATSLQDFWGNRWNLTVTDTLRHTVYNPTRVFSSQYLDKNWTRTVGTMSAFIVSGLMHELIFFYVTRVTPSWEVTWFFVLHGICVTVEVGLKKALGRKVKLHWALTGPLTVGFVMWTGYLWFFQPLVRNQVDIRAFHELKSLYSFFIGNFKLNI